MDVRDLAVSGQENTCRMTAWTYAPRHAAPSTGHRTGPARCTQRAGVRASRQPLDRAPPPCDVVVHVKLEPAWRHRLGGHEQPVMSMGCADLSVRIERTVGKAQIGSPSRFARVIEVNFAAPNRIVRPEARVAAGPVRTVAPGHGAFLPACAHLPRPCWWRASAAPSTPGLGSGGASDELERKGRRAFVRPA
jgi:hypothetical protein